MNATALTATDVSEEKKDSFLSLHDAVILCDEENLKIPELIDFHDVNESPVEQNDAHRTAGSFLEVKPVEPLPDKINGLK